MTSLMNNGPAMTLLDFTSDFSTLLMGLVLLVGLSAAMIIRMAIRSFRSQLQQPATVKEPPAVDQRDAA